MRKKMTFRGSSCRKNKNFRGRSRAQKMKFRGSICRNNKNFRSKPGVSLVCLHG